MSTPARASASPWAGTDGLGITGRVTAAVWNAPLFNFISSFGIRRSRSLDRHLRSSRIRVVVNALHAKSGGGVTYLRNLLPLLADDSRLELHVFLHRSQLDLFHPIDERVIVHLFDFPKGLLRLMLWEQVVMPVMLVIMSADVVFSPANFGTLLVRDQVILLRNALAVARSETRLLKRLYWTALGAITFMSLLRVKRAIAVSSYAAKSLSLGYDSLFRHKLRIIHHGINSDFRAVPDYPRQDFILAVSDIYVQKNLHNLFRAMKLVCQRHPNVKLLVAGQKIDEWYYDRGLDLLRELEIADNVTFLGRLNVDRLRSLYQDCACFVFPSTAETFGLPLVEAMACGAPIASSRSTAMPEIVNDAALLFDPNDVQAMADCLVRLLEDQELRRVLSEKAIRRAADFSWQETARKTADVLLEAAHARS